MQKTPEQIQILKDDWRNDPCWDIEETKGFESHKDELLEYRLRLEKEWSEKGNFRLKKKATKLGIPDRLDLVKHIEDLERRIQTLSDRWLIYHLTVTSITMDKEILQAQIEILEQLQPTTAYTGSLDRLEQKSYILYADVIKLLNDKRKQLKNHE